MLRLAVISTRGRLGTFVGALAALVAASVLAMAWGMQLESILRTHPPVERYAAATAVVTGQQTAGTDHDVSLTERARVSAGLAAAIRRVPGVRAAITSIAVVTTLVMIARGAGAS
jgi:putative ABC transport system permease protein